ncbi:hypothetical protein JXR93_07410 [bacterium]|nr:hypothetical protein [bacterium]
MKVGEYITTLLNGYYLTAKKVAFRVKLDNIRKKLSPYLLTYNPNLGDKLSLKDLEESSPKFLNFYSIYGIDLALDRYGIKNYLSKIGIKKLFYKIKTENYTHTLSIYDTPDFKNPMIFQVIITLNKSLCFEDFRCNSLVIEWMTLQNYHKSFKIGKYPLPGQNYPGLGIGHIAFEMIIQIAKRLKLNYIVNTPDHFHNAVIYSKYFYFKRASDLAIIRNLISEYPTLNLAILSWLVTEEAVVFKHNHEVLKWDPDYMITPISPCKNLKKYFSSSEYRKNYQDAISKYSFLIDFDLYQAKRKNYPLIIQEEIDKFMDTII